LDIASPAVLLTAESGDSGGIGRYCVDLAGALGERARVVCLCPVPCAGAGGCWLAGQCATRGARLLSVAMPTKDWRTGLSGLVGLWKRTGRPLIHVNGRRGNSIAMAARLTVPGLHYVTTVHGLLDLHSRRNAVYRLVDLAACHTANAVIAVSADTGRRLARAGSPRARTYVVPNGLAEDDMNALCAVADRRSGAGRNGSPLRLGFLGRLSPEKGTRELLQVSRRLYESGARATVAIAGDGPDREWLMAESRAMLESGFMSYRGVAEDAASFLAEVDVLVMPSHNEGMPYVLLEGMAAGCAVVAFGVGGIPEVLDDPSLGVLIRPGDTDELAGSLERLCEAPDMATKIGEAGSEQVRERFTLGSRLPLISQAYGIDFTTTAAPGTRRALGPNN
jgi:glycosyltransferase involved in cell wall biosynthesis